MSTYKETIDYLYNSTPMFHKVGSAAYKEGLENTLALDEYFGHPHEKFKTIHVGGTNGKGSCSSMIASYLQEMGYKVGLYTSPHLYSFRERIRVNGEMIAEKDVVDFVDNHRHFFEPLMPSFFELTTAMAFKYFADQQVDIAVIEVGLGGKLDCTNIIRPLLSVITNISLDHTALLGDTLPLIAKQKAGIIKHGVPVVIGETTLETKTVFELTASEVDADIHYAEEETTMQEVEEYFMDCELKGNYQKLNLRTVLTAVKIDPLRLPHKGEGSAPKVEYDIERHSVLPLVGELEGVFRTSLRNISKNTGIMGRWQTVCEQPKTIIDTGHNKAGWEFVSQMLSDCVKNCNTLRIVFGMVDDKDVDSVMQMLPKEAVYYFTQAQSHRAIPCNIIKEKGNALGLCGKAYPTSAEAYDAAKNDAAETDVIFIGGSNYIIGDLKL
ncbi:MAG: bifunctional folylpolyglutamate synthase/dihydrofolate synthase [Bacteroidaceae bacterium]|nr:bifunctional folylpolyglutamate synthase/dihydrofolate synthase [Bacteroidaceae bacterium]